VKTVQVQESSKSKIRFLIDRKNDI
jgi:hypothetical protein